jgi:hypothetical protein
MMRRYGGGKTGTLTTADGALATQTEPSRRPVPVPPRTHLFFGEQLSAYSDV